MAIRPVFEVGKEKCVRVESYEFKWYPGFAKSQKQKSCLLYTSDAADEPCGV